MDLFDHAMQDRMKIEAPLAARMRRLESTCGAWRAHAAPGEHMRRLESTGGARWTSALQAATVGQEDALRPASVGPGKLLRRAIEADRLLTLESSASILL